MLDNRGNRTCQVTYVPKLLGHTLSSARALASCGLGAGNERVQFVTSFTVRIKFSVGVRAFDQIILFLHV